MEGLAKWITDEQHRPWVVLVSAFVGVVAAAEILWTAVVAVLPSVTGVEKFGWSIVAGLIVGTMSALIERLRQYRVAIRGITRDYIVAKQDLDYLRDPEHHGPGQSERVRAGLDGADPAWGDQVMDKYHLPRQKEYR